MLTFIIIFDRFGHTVSDGNYAHKHSWNFNWLLDSNFLKLFTDFSRYRPRGLRSYGHRFLSHWTVSVTNRLLPSVWLTPSPVRRTLLAEASHVTLPHVLLPWLGGYVVQYALVGCKPFCTWYWIFMACYALTQDTVFIQDTVFTVH